MEGNCGLLQKRLVLSKGMKELEKNKNTKHKRSHKNSGYMFNFFGNDDGDNDQEEDTSSEAGINSPVVGTVNQEDSESDSDTTEDSGPSVPNLKKRKIFDRIREDSVNAYSHDRNITTLQDTCQPGSSEKRRTDSSSDSADTDEICASEQRQCKEGKISCKEGKHKVQQEEKYSSLQDNLSERIKPAVIQEKSVSSGELQVKGMEKVRSLENMLIEFNGKESSRDGSRHDAGSKCNGRGNSKEDCVSDSSANDSDDGTSGTDDGSSVGESADADEICSMTQKQSQIKFKTENSLNIMKLENKNVEKKQENTSTGDGFNNQESSGSGSHCNGKAEISHVNKTVEDNVDAGSMRSDDTCECDDNSNEEETESDDDLLDEVEISSGKQRQRQADAKAKPLSNKDDIDGSFVHSIKTHTGMMVNEETTNSVKNEKGNHLSVCKRESGSDDSSPDTDGSTLNSAPSLKRKRESDEGLSDTGRVGSSKKDRMEGEAVEQHSPKKVRQEEQENKGKIGPLSPQGNLTGAKFELLVLDRNILAQQGYNTTGAEGEESSLEDMLELSESDEDSDSGKENTKGKKKNKLVMPEFKGMNFYRKHFRDGEGNEWKENQTSRGQDVSTDEMNARSKEEFIAVKAGELPGHKGSKSLKKRKRKKDNDLESGDDAYTLDVGRSTQLKMKMERVSKDTSDEYIKEQLEEEENKTEMSGIERQDDKGCEVDDSRVVVTSESKRSQKLVEDSGRGRDADDESSDLENLVNGDNGSSSRKRKKKKKHKEKEKEEKNENITQKGKNSAAFTDSLSLINAVQNKYSKESGHPHSTNATNKEESVKVTKEGLQGNELQSVRGVKGESSVISSGGESMEDATKSFTDRMAEFGKKFIKKKVSDGGRSNKEYKVKQKRQALPEKQPAGIVENKNEKTKMDISNQDTAEISNQKRLQAIKERQEQVKNKQKAIQAALAKVDERKQPDAKKHLRFDSESEEEPEFSEEVEEKKKDTSKVPSLALFADENNEESGSDEDWFQVKPQFEGEKGLELLKLQRKFGDDERFRLDERFAEEDDDDTEDKHEEDGDDGDLETEKTKALSILENVLGNMLPSKKSTEDKKTKFRDMGQVRFDPSREDHEKFLLPRQEVSETNSKPKKKRKKKKQTEGAQGIVEAPLPEVSKEVFFDVKSDLTSALNQSEQVTFGFFNDSEDKEETQENKEEEYFLPPAEFVWSKQKLPYDSSESEGEAEEPETTKQSETTKHRETLSLGNPIEMEHQSSRSFFFGRNDHRLKDGASQFCRPKDSPLKDNWEEKRMQLWAATYKRHQKALRDNKQNRKQRRPFKHP
ncbi:Nucleolar protein 8 [Holothuria leucospilota]|uniref:Nucleolar protein 8 n=1 Tax=Holothuria leucospilota TaxID=206669 RepID=A0A9Q1CKI8_HOLLE|nr:Nucleolar protein 8 [Holothuria leucospilota]